MEKLIYTPDEVAELLRTRKATVQKQIDGGLLPAYREGRNWKIPRQALEKYVMERAVKETAKRTVK